MPMASEIEKEGKLVRCLLYGKDKTKKTWWACRAAEAGFNVILLDGDDGSSIVLQLPMEARKRILVVDAVNTREKATFALFMASFTKRNQKEFLWDEQRKASFPGNFTRDPNHSYIKFDPTKLTPNDVVVIDSWTALAASTLIQYSMETGFDLTEVEREGDQFAHLNFQARFLDHVLNEIHALPCHVLIIGHETQWERYKGVDNKKKGLSKTYVGSYTQPISSTGPQGDKLGKHFNDVLRFYKLSDTAYRIDAGGDGFTAGGSRLLAPKVYDWKEITPQLLLNTVGAKATGEPCRGAVYIPRGAVVENNVTEIPVASEKVVPISEPQAIGSGNSLAERIRLSKANAK